MGLFVVVMLMYASHKQLMQKYADLESAAITDRHGVLLTLSPNQKGAYGEYAEEFPERVKELMVQKEDRFFYFHPGINPFSTLRAGFRYVAGSNVGGASTITQQLVKNLLGNEQRRSFSNKVVELWYAFALELFASKEQILTMYGNTVYLGNQAQGLSEASVLYFGKPIEALDDTKLMMLLASLSSPSKQNPWTEENARVSRNLAIRLGIDFDPSVAIVKDEHAYSPTKHFELASMGITCTRSCTTTLDQDLTDRLRTMLQEKVLRGWDAGARSGAIVVLKLPEKELLAIVGTPNTKSMEEGQQINMAIEPRPIGSTAKPFIYLEGFRKGLRPYTLVNDREYKFPIGSGFPLYPKNYDGMYRGWITLHSALSNSLNIPSVRTLEFVGLPEFYAFLEHSLGLRPKQDLDEYQYGIALGALEMDPLTLAHFLSIFPQQGILKPVKLFRSGSTPTITTPMSMPATGKKVAEPGLTELVTRILNDRISGVQQFGLASNLNLSQSNYAVKTGTSQDYHDSWTVGYTPDFLVVVWYGNPDNTPLKHVTGQSGAGAIWHDTMEMLMNSEYNKKTPFDFSHTKEVLIDGSIDFGLPNDVVKDHRTLLRDDSLITAPLDGDTFLKETRTTVPLISPEAVSWYANGAYIGDGARAYFSPPQTGDYIIRAVGERGSAQITVHVVSRE